MLNSVIQSSMTLGSFLLCVAVAIVLGVLNALVFSFKDRRTKSLTVAQAILPAIVTIVIMMVNGKISAGLAVAGTFALVRFRSAPGTAKDIAGLFLGVAIGLACGMGYVAIAALFFLIMAAFVILLTVTRFGEVKGSYRTLKITIPENLDYDGLFDDLFKKYTVFWELHRVKTSNMGTLFELSYDIFLKDADVSKEFIDAIRCRNGNLPVVCGRFSDKDMM